jgi:lysozyme family protein
MTADWREDGVFQAALHHVLRHEGGFVDDAADPGGATNWGVSLRWLRSLGDTDGDGYADGDFDRDGDVDAADIARLTRDQAAALYHERWWLPLGYRAWPASTVATKAFDLAVNMGATSAHRCVQRALRAVTGQALVEDGVIGPATLAAMRRRPPAAWSDAELRAALKSEAAGHYRLLIARNPKLARFENGWLNRAYW